MPTRIRAAVPDDAATLLRFIRELAAYEREPDAVQATVEQLRDQLRATRPPFECLIAEEDTDPRGFALYFTSYSTWRGRPGIYLEDLYVPPEYRGQGIGRQLLARLAQIAADRGCARLEWAVLDWNRPAIEFYEALGAMPMTGWTTWRLDRDALTRLATRASA